MHDPKFEKEVQQKMAELEFSPSESVWANVEKELNQRHTRRSFPFFWRLALPGLLLLAGGGYYFFRSNPAAVSPAYPVAVTTTHTVPTTPATRETATGATPSTAAAPLTRSTAPTTAAPPTAAAPSTRSTSSPSSIASLPTQATSSPLSTPAHPVVGSNTREGNAISLTPHRVKRTKTPLAGQSDESFGTISKSSTTAETNGTGSVATQPVTNGDIVTAAPGAGSANAATPSASSTSTTKPAIQPFLFNPALANLSSSAAPILAGQLTSQKAIAIKKLQSPRRAWEAAFAGGIGVSSLHQVQLSNVALNNTASSISGRNAASPSRDSNTNNLTYTAARPSKQYISTVKPGVSFWAGVLAQKPLSERWALSLGLNLYYYSTRVSLGEQVSAYVPSTATLFSSSAVAPIQSYPYYNAGNQQAYTNRYYFLELPVAAEWKINRSHLLPLFWDGGFSLSYLMGSSAVYYNTKSGVYFKDGGVANRTQINISTALMVGLPVKGLRVQVGPQIQYGLTPLLNTDLSGPQHIFYGGIRLVVYPGKK